MKEKSRRDMRRNKSELKKSLVELQNTITSTKEEILAAVAELREFVRVLNDDQAAAADRRFSGFPDVVALSVRAAINDVNDRVVAEVAESRELIIKTLLVGK